MSASQTPRTDAELARLKAMPVHICNMIPAEFTRELEREISEAKSQIEANHKATLVIEHMLYEAREQRDRLAEASLTLADIAEKNTDDGDLWQKAIESVRKLAAVKGGSNE